MAKKKVNKKLMEVPKSVNDDLPEEEKRYNKKRPYLLSRLGAGFLDLLASVAIAVGLQFLLAYLLYAPLGYYSAHENALNVLEESHLYYKTFEGDYELLTYHYDENKTVEENLDSPIVYYYTNVEYPKSYDKLKEYNTAKGATGYWDENGNRSSTFNETQAKIWLTERYEDATNFCETNPTYVNNGYHMVYVTYFTLLLSITIGSMPFYLIVPLLNKKGATPFQLVFKMGLADKDTDRDLKKSQIVLRYIFILGFDFLLPEVWWYFFDAVQYLFGISFFADLAVMCFTSHNTSLHDLISRSYVISTRGENDLALDLAAKTEKEKDKTEKKDSLDEGKIGNDFFD